MSDDRITNIARVCHEANTAYCIGAGDPALPHWDDLDETYLDSSRKGVQAALNGATPKAMHESWMAERTSQGWVYGETLDRAAKVHPNLIPYDMLPISQQRKDALFLAVVNALK